MKLMSSVRGTVWTRRENGTGVWLQLEFGLSALSLWIGCRAPKDRFEVQSLRLVGEL